MDSKSMGIHNFEADYRRTIERIKRSTTIIDDNKAKTLEYADHLLSENIGFAKVNRYMQDLVRLDRMLRKSFHLATEQDMRHMMSELNQSNYSEHTKRGFKIAIKKFYRFLRGITQPKFYPPEVSWIPLRMANNHIKLPEELLTEEEIKGIINNCECLRDKALIASLAESGARIGEIGDMLIKHVSFEQHGARLTVQGKTGGRKVLVIWSTPYIQEWINQHPKNNKPDSPLWYSQQRCDFLSYQRIAAILKLAAKRAGITKRVHPHLLRHSRATHMATIMTEAGMKQYFGWTQGSTMAGIYVHMSGKDTDDAVLNANGIKIEKEAKTSIMQPKKCLRCKIVNEITNRCCKQCGLILDEQHAQEILIKDSEKAKVNEAMQKLFQDSQFIEMVKSKLANP